MNKPQPIDLRPTTTRDLETLFEFQTDAEAGYLAAFMPEDPTDKQAYLAKYTKLLSDSTVNQQTIETRGTIAGHVAKFLMHGDSEITYWIDKRFWGKGIATRAVQAFLLMETGRPVFGRVAFDNFGSQRVLEKCGFKKIGTDSGFAHARQAETAEFIYRLD